MARPIRTLDATGSFGGTTSRMAQLARADFLDYVSAIHGGLRRVVVEDRLTEEELSSVKKLAFSVDRFEPFASALIAPRTLDRLVEAGVAETGDSCRPAVGAIGYRLTDNGWRIAREHWTEPRAPAVVEGRGAFY